MNSSVNNSYFQNLNNEQIWEILKHLPIKDAQSSASVCKKFNEVIKNYFPWSLIANGMGIQPEEDETILDLEGRVKNEALELMKDIQAIKQRNDEIESYEDGLREEIPQDILQILNSDQIPTANEIKLLQDYKRSRDIIIVWDEIKCGAHINVVYPEDFFRSSKTMIERAKEFKEWFKQNAEELNGVEHLSLRQEALSSLPPEIWRLPNLSMLDLKDNRLAKPPEKIEKSGLRMLDLSGNKFKLPLEIGKLKRGEDGLFHYSLTGNLGMVPRYINLRLRMFKN